MTSMIGPKRELKKIENLVYSLREGLKQIKKLAFDQKGGGGVG